MSPCIPDHEIPPAPPQPPKPDTVGKTDSPLALIAQDLVWTQRASANAIALTGRIEHVEQHVAYSWVVGLFAKHLPDVLQAAIEVIDANIQHRAARYVNEDGTPQAAEFSPEFLAAIEVERAQQLGQHVPTAGGLQAESATAPIHRDNLTDLDHCQPPGKARPDGTAAQGAA